MEQSDRLSNGYRLAGVGAKNIDGVQMQNPMVKFLPLIFLNIEFFRLHRI